MNINKLAINGGPKIRDKRFPCRRLFGRDELNMVIKVFEDSWQNGIDFAYQGKYEELYTEKFCHFQGGGFADAVSSGTAAVYLALSALNIEAGSDVIVSPVTDSGGVAPVITLGLNVVVADSERNGFNVGPVEFEKALTPNTRAAILTHTGGHPVDMAPILEIANSKGISIIEDCSQAHGSIYKGERVGRFGDIGVFSTMFSKNHATGGCGGIVYTKNKELYWLIRSLADRGKPFENSEFDPKNPGEFLFPALNFNLDELSCAIGLSTLSRLQDTIDKPFGLARKIDSALAKSSVVFPCKTRTDSTPSLYFHTVEVATDKLRVPKREFAEAIAAEGIWLNTDYKYVVAEWKWLQKYLRGEMHTPNATDFRDRTFNLLFTERFSDEDVKDIISSILKVESSLSVR